MRTFALLLSLCLPIGSSAQAPTATSAPVELSTGPLLGVSTITVTAPRLRENALALKAARAGGAGAAAGGLGIFAYAVIFDAAGPIGWAAGLIFFGGMTAYLSHRRLHGHDDFSPDEARKSGAAARP